MINRLNQREKQFVMIGGVVAGLLLLVAGFWPLLTRVGGVDARLAAKQAELVRARELQQQLQQISVGLQLRQRRMTRAGGGSPLALVEATTVRLGCRDNLVTVRPQAATSRDGVRIEPLELRFEKISLEQLARLLAAFEETDQLLKVQTLKVRRRFDNAAQLDVQLALEALREEG